MLIQIDRKNGTLTFRMPKLFKKLKHLLEAMGDRAKRQGRFCMKERLVNGEAFEVLEEDTDQKAVRTPMALNHKDIYEESSDENPIVPYDTYLTVAEFWV